MARWRVCALSALLGLGLYAIPSSGAGMDARAGVRVKYVAEGSVYLEAGRNLGLAEGMKLVVERLPEVPAYRAPAKPATADSPKQQPPADPVIAHIRVSSVAQISAVCEVLDQKQDVQVGDLAFLEPADAEALTQKEALGPTRKYPQVVTFTEGDPLDEEARESVPQPPLPEVNRARGRIGMEYGGLSTSGSSSSFASQYGMVLQADITRIGGSYWNLRGFWRGRFNTVSGNPGAQTINDLINRTYHLVLSYDNPNSHWVAGFGRFYLPWATSLDTIDGGYLGRRLGKNVTLGTFGGSTPDPTSWDYNPDRRIAGTFVNFEGGSFDATKYSATFGVGASSIGSWTPNRLFLFTETEVAYKQFLSVYDSLVVDRPQVQLPNGTNNGTTTMTNTAGISRSFVTVRIQPVKRFELDLNHNYFRDFPSFDLNLVSTGLVDKLLFQGFSVGSRIDLTKQLTFYNSLGRSSQSTDAHSSWNQMYGLTLGQIWRTGIRADVRYTKFNSPYATGTYEALFLSRSFRDNLRWEVRTGEQNLVSALTRQDKYRGLGTTLDWTPGSRLFLSLNFDYQHGVIQNYSQWFMSFGYRFDNRSVAKTMALRQ